MHSRMHSGLKEKEKKVRTPGMNVKPNFTLELML